MAKEFKEQAAHFWSNWLWTMIGNIPLLGPLFQTWLWAITREYYQWKLKYFKSQNKEPSFKLTIKKMRFWKLDMHWSNGGNAFATLCWFGIWWWILTIFKVI